MNRVFKILLAICLTSMVLFLMLVARYHQIQQSQSPLSDEKPAARIVWVAHGNDGYVGYFENLSPSSLPGVSISIDQVVSEENTGFHMGNHHEIVEALWDGKQKETQISSSPPVLMPGGGVMVRGMSRIEPNEQNVWTGQSVQFFLSAHDLSFPAPLLVKTNQGKV